MFYGNRKILLVYLNDKIIYTYQPLFPKNFDRYKANISIYPVKGNNNISFRTSGFLDSSGFRLSSVEIKKNVNTQLMDVLDIEYSVYFLQSIISFPGSRIILGELANFLISLDRYQLYAFHNRKYSNYSSTFINRTSDLLNKKGLFSKTILNFLFPQLV